MFTEVDASDAQKQAFDSLVEIVRPIVENNPRLSGGDLAIKTFEEGIGIQETFGGYTGVDFTSAARTIKGLPLGRVRNAKTD